MARAWRLGQAKDAALAAPHGGERNALVLELPEPSSKLAAMKINHGTALALALALTASAAGAGDTPLPPGFEGGRAYSNLCIDPEGGDVGGYRITVKGSGARTRIAVEVGQGGLTGPFMAHIHPGKTGKIAFSIPREELGDGLQGIVRGDVAVIHVPGDTPPIQRLRRRNDVHGFRACR